MYLYIVTPTFNALPWLQRCVRSVADQSGPGLTVHHHVQDGGSCDGTPDWLAAWQQPHADAAGYRFSYESARDKGMYDAINLAWERMPEQADITAHLNSDEQYLPGALAAIAAAMQATPEADIALGTYIIVDAQSRYICHRRPVKPRLWSSRTVCEIITCSCFHRATAFRRHGIRFDTRWRALADLVFYRDITATRPRVLMLPELITSSFAVTGGNLAWSATAEEEWKRWLAGLPRHVACCRFPMRKWVNFKRRLVDKACPAPQHYSIYPEGGEERVLRRIRRPTAYWGCRSEGEED